jgi:hypothetical protein
MRVYQADVWCDACRECYNARERRRYAREKSR